MEKSLEEILGHPCCDPDGLMEAKCGCDCGCCAYPEDYVEEIEED